MITTATPHRRYDSRNEELAGKQAHPFGIVDALTVLYIMSFYTLLNIQDLSWISAALGSLMFGILIFKHLLLKPLHFPRLFWAPWLFLLFNIVSLLWCKDILRGIDEIKMIASAVIGAMAVWLAIENGTSVRTLLYGMIIGSTILMGSGITEISNMGSRGRIIGLAGNSNLVAMYLSYPFMFSWCVQDKKMGRLRLLGVGLVAYVFMYTGSRKAVVVLAALLSFLLIYFLSNFKKVGMWKRVGVVLLLLVALIAAVDRRVLTDRASEVLESNQVVARSSTVEEEEQKVGWSANVRRKMINVALDLWAESPIVGHGSGQFAVKGGFGVTYAHNNYVELLTNLGIVGLACFYVLPIAMFVRALRSPKRFSQNVPFWSSILTVVIAVLMLDFLTVTLYSKAHWVFIVGIMQLIDKEERGSFAQRILRR